MPEAQMQVELLEDGTIRVTTSKVPGVHHLSAEEYLNFVEKTLGGERKTVKRKPTQVHQHAHDHVHQGHGHTHD